MTAAEFVDVVSSFPEVVEHAHFNRRAFKINGRRIFATLDEKGHSANLKLSLVDQSVFCGYDGHAVYPVPNKWSLHGWTTFELDKIPKALMLDAVNTAYQETAKSR